MGAVGYVSGLDAEAVGADPEGTAVAVVAAHAAAVDPHADRAYADDEIDDATTGMVLTSDPRLSDARTPTAHSHGVDTGGTGLAVVAAGSYLKGNGTAALVPRTPAQVRTDLGFDMAWVAPTNLAAGVTNAAGAWYNAGMCVGPDGFHHWRGRLLAAQNYTANAQIFILDPSVRPLMDVEVPARFVGVGAANGFLKVIASTGVVSFSASITVGAASGWPLDGINFWGGANS